MSNFRVSVNWNDKNRKKLLNQGNIVTYAVARRVLDISLPNIPLKTGKMRSTSMSAGVRGSNGNYYIGSYTNYAKYVWVMPKSTHWSEPNTFGKWYETNWKKKGKSIVENVIKENELK